MKSYKTKLGKLPGSSYEEVMPLARKEYRAVQSRTKRQPYIHSKYFSRDKIFINAFWNHLAQKHRADRTKRLKFYNCALDLLKNTTEHPDTIFSKKNPRVILHRFMGETANHQIFYVQVKQDKKTGRKDFISVFPKK